MERYLDPYNYPPIIDPDASVPSVADLEKLVLPEFDTFPSIPNSTDCFIMDEEKPMIKPEPQYEAPNPAVGGPHRHFDFSIGMQNPGPSTPIHYSPNVQVSSEQSSPLSHVYSEEDYSEGEQRPASYTVSPAKWGGGARELMHLPDEELAKYSARDINKLCKGCSEEFIKQIKKRRRTLKNRGYASNSRVRRLQQKTELESSKVQLQDEVLKLRAEVEDMRNQRDYYKKRAELLSKAAPGSLK